jgi:hypothetical protein
MPPGLKFFQKVWKVLERAKKKGTNEYKLSLGGRRPKPIGALNSPRIGKKFELKKFQNFCLERSLKVWKELKKSPRPFLQSPGCSPG